MSNRDGLESLLPLMGPLTVGEARVEVDYHAGSRGFDETHIDWSGATTRFAPVDIDPRSLLPVDESG